MPTGTKHRTAGAVAGRGEASGSNEQLLAQFDDQTEVHATALCGDPHAALGGMCHACRI